MDCPVIFFLGGGGGREKVIFECYYDGCRLWLFLYDIIIIF